MRAYVICCLVVLGVGLVLAAPHASRRDQDFSKSFIEFVQQDAELSALLRKTEFGNNDALVRHVREAEEEMFDEQDNIPGKQEPGFFDRAAKFVMEVLQRFLKWVNTDN